MTRRLGTWAALVGFLTIAGLPVAHAQPRLEYSAPAECPSAEIVSRALARRVEPTPTGVDERTVTMRVSQIPAPADPYLLEVVLSGPEAGGRRLISGRDCETLVNAGVVAAALALGARPETLSEPLVLEVTEPSGASSAPVDPASEEPGAEAIEGSPEAPPEPESIPPPASPPRQATPSEGPGAQLGAWLAGRLSLGEAPTVTGGVALGLSLTVSRFTTELAFQWLPRSAGYVDGNSGAGAELALFLAEVRFCGDLLLRPVVLGLCGGVEVGAIRAQGVGADITTSVSSFWLAPEVGTILLWPFTASGRLGLKIDAALLVPVYRTTFYIEGIGDIYKPAPVAGKLGIGFFLNFF